MSHDTLQDTLIEDSAAKLFSTQVDKERRLRAETGEWDAALWAQVADSGFHLLLASEASGGYGQGWTAAYPLLRGLGYWQVPLPLAETMVAAFSRWMWVTGYRPRISERSFSRATIADWACFKGRNSA